MEKFVYLRRLYQAYQSESMTKKCPSPTIRHPMSNIRARSRKSKVRRKSPLQKSNPATLRGPAGFYFGGRFFLHDQPHQEKRHDVHNLDHRVDGGAGGVFNCVPNRRGKFRLGGEFPRADTSKCRPCEDSEFGFLERLLS